MRTINDLRDLVLQHMKWDRDVTQKLSFSAKANELGLFLDFQQWKGDVELYVHQLTVVDQLLTADEYRRIIAQDVDFAVEVLEYLYHYYRGESTPVLNRLSETGNFPPNSKIGVQHLLFADLFPDIIPYQLYDVSKGGAFSEAKTSLKDYALDVIFSRHPELKRDIYSQPTGRGFWNRLLDFVQYNNSFRIGYRQDLSKMHSGDRQRFEYATRFFQKFSDYDPEKHRKLLDEKALFEQATAKAINYPSASFEQSDYQYWGEKMPIPRKGASRKKTKFGDEYSIRVETEIGVFISKGTSEGQAIEYVIRDFAYIAYRKALVDRQESERFLLDTHKTQKPMNRILGKEITINLPNGEKHRGQFAIVSLADIIASHNEETFATSPGFPVNASGGNINDRNYAGDPNAQALVIEYARDLDPTRLITTSRTPSGSPIIHPDGFVVSGNNRTMSLKLAAKRHPSQYQAYQTFLQEDWDSFGFPVGYDKVKVARPTLVRIDYDAELTTQGLAKYNQSTMKGKSPTDKAIELSNILRENLLCNTNIPAIIGEFETMSDFYANPGAQKRMLDALIQCNLVTEQQKPEFFVNGTFTEGGKNFIETVLASVVLDREALQSAQADGVKSLRKTVVNALPALMANNALSADARILPEVSKAIRLQYTIVRLGLAWQDYITQLQVFDEVQPTRQTWVLNRLLNAQRTFKKAVMGYNDSLKASAGNTMFASEAVTPNEAFLHYFENALDPGDLKPINRKFGQQSSPFSPLITRKADILKNLKAA